MFKLITNLYNVCAEDSNNSAALGWESSANMMNECLLKLTCTKVISSANDAVGNAKKDKRVAKPHTKSEIKRSVTGFQRKGGC